MTDFQPGDVVLTVDGCLYTRADPESFTYTGDWIDGGWLRDGQPPGMERLSDSDLPKPLVLLVRNRKRIGDND